MGKKNTIKFACRENKQQWSSNKAYWSGIFSPWHHVPMCFISFIPQQLQYLLYLIIISSKHHGDNISEEVSVWKHVKSCHLIWKINHNCPQICHTFSRKPVSMGIGPTMSTRAPKNTFGIFACSRACLCGWHTFNITFISLPTLTARVCTGLNSHQLQQKGRGKLDTGIACQ